MLNFYRKNIKLFIWLIILSFAIWGAGSISVSTQTAASYVGTVGKEKISEKEFILTTRYFDLLTRAKFAQNEAEKKAKESKEKEAAGTETTAEKTETTPKEEKKEETPKTDTQESKPAEENQTPSEPQLPSQDEIKSIAWQTIVLSREAKNSGIVITDEDVQNEIRRQFSVNGAFQQDFYEMWVENNLRVPQRDFEEMIRRHLASDKLHEKVLKDVPEDQKNSKWLEFIIPVMSKSELKDLGEPAKA